MPDQRRATIIQARATSSAAADTSVAMTRQAGRSVARASAMAPQPVPRSATAAAGVYRGEVRIAAEHGGELAMPLAFTVRKGTLDPVDIPAGPWGHTIDLPWYEDEAAAWNRAVAVKSLQKLREYGFTSVSGLPVVTFHGFKDGKPQFDFKQGDAQMKLLKENGFTMPIVSYCAFNGLNTYFKDEAAMKAAGFSDYSEFIKAVFGAVQKHADEAGWLPVYWNIGDEPAGDDVIRSAENAEAFRKAFDVDDGAVLIVKSVNGQHRPERRAELEALAAGRADIRF